MLDDRNGFNAYLASLNGEVELVLQKYRKNRTIPQNNFYRAYLHVIAKDTGHSEEELHEFFKTMCLETRIVMMFGKAVEVKGSTTDLSKAGMWKYMQKIEALTGIPIPDPNKVTISSYD